jgi:phospholipid transport system substrate-binding protein
MTRRVSSSGSPPGNVYTAGREVPTGAGGAGRRAGGECPSGLDLWGVRPGRAWHTGCTVKRPGPVMNRWLLRSPLRAMLLSALLLSLTTPAHAGAPTEQLKTSVEQIVRVLEDPALRTEGKVRERRAAIRKEAEVIFDFGETARRALGRHWQALGASERAEFTGLFTDLIERAYISKIERYSGERIAFAGESVEGGLASVRTRFVTKKGTEIPVDYRMQQRGDRWLVYDVSVEGVSLINNYRTQFDKIIQTSSYAELVRKMKAAEVAAPGAPRS